MSFGLFSSLPSKWLAITVTLPSASGRVTLLVACSQHRTRPCRSNVKPLDMWLGRRKSSVPLALQAQITSPGMSLNSKRRLRPSHSGPSVNSKPVAIASKATDASTMASIAESRTSTLALVLLTSGL